MADVTHTSAGYTGTVDQIAEAKRLALVAGAPFKAASASDWAVTAYASSNRTVQIAAGSAVCCGVRDTTGAVATLTVGTNTSGSTRYDVIVATFNWAAGTPTTSFAVITGTSSGIPTINTGGSVVAGQINRIPGVQYDAVLAVVAVPNNAGVLSSGNVFDRRPYGGGGGPLTVPSENYLTAIDMGSGGEIISAATGAHWTLAGGTWSRVPSRGKVFTTLAARDSYFSGTLAPVAGDQCMCLGTTMTHDGTAWRFTLTGTFTGSCDANGYFSFPHGGGQTPTAWGPVVSAQSTDALTLVVKHVAWGYDGTNLTVRTVRTDSSTYIVANPVNGYWWAKF